MAGSKVSLLRARMAFGFGGIGAEKRNAIGRLRGSGAGFLRRRRDPLQRIFKILRGKLVFRVVAGNGDQNLAGQFDSLSKCASRGAGRSVTCTCAPRGPQANSATKSDARGKKNEERRRSDWHVQPPSAQATERIAFDATIVDW